jgi:hypothetical protein
VRKYLIYGAVAFIAWYILTAPDAAANSMQAILGGLEDLGNGFATFLEQLFV